ncbi:cellulose 1,4-beta-cellobiosidase, partial [Acetivibrio thermocellus YS]
MEIKSDFTQIACGVTPSFYACGNHKVILSGTESQKITMEEPNSCFNVLELKNTSEEGVSFLTQVAFLEGIITNNVPTNFSRKGALGWTLSSNEEINGDFYLVGGTLDLNGYKLKINGNLIHSGGTIVLNGGQLTVNGDYRIQTELENKDKDGKTVYDQSYGVLKMTNPEDYILVMGDFVMQNYYQTKDSKVLSDGVLEIKGDFTQIACGVTPSFYACENHKVILSGTKLQRITMEETYS